MFSVFLLMGKFNFLCIKFICIASFVDAYGLSDLPKNCINSKRLSLAMYSIKWLSYVED